MDTLCKETLKSVDPTEPAAAYVGGKIKLAKTIIKIIEGIPHRTYAEPLTRTRSWLSNAIFAGTSS
ncbi:hypothetical protein ME9_00964 [Bartonella taylorii 8TBB]|uniref:Uncharacterized protein n=1 Tax=Bartonella taylorii 8TBB TaxID=1094560 RepID=A0A9P2W2Z3_BARTA|nr:hypothetical protein ME9_01665 [Bartonella taylorii 8TBB]EJF94380.1 hypothetical protein ME9_00964 [Bartonella taylorii 8TBB]